MTQPLSRTAAAKAVSEAAREANSNLAPMMKEWRADGSTLAEIASKLNTEGHTTRKGKPWNPAQVRRALLAEAGALKRRNHLASLPLADGEWWPNRAAGIFKRKDSEIFCTHAFLTKQYDGKAGRPRIPLGFWNELLRKERVEACRVKDGNGFIILWPQRGVDVAVEERITGTPNAIPGEWIGNMFRHKEDGECLRAVPMAQKIRRSVAYLTYRRTRPHKALGGKIPRSHLVEVEIDPRQKWNGPRERYVYCVVDWVKIAEWEAARKSQLPTQPRKGWRFHLDIAKEMKCQTWTEKNILLDALKQFAEGHPNSVEPIVIEDTAANKHGKPLNRHLESLSYDFLAFKRWLGNRELAEVGKPRRSNRWLRRTVLFLQFVLTRGYWSAREFGRFCDSPPRGPLEPCDPVPVDQIKAWARKVRIETEIKLSKAKQKAGVKDRQEGRRGERRSVWFLPGPVTIARPPWETHSGANGDGGSTGSHGSPSGTPQATKNLGGRPRKDDTLTVQQFCYFWRIVKGLERPDVLDRARRAVKNGELKKAPPGESNVTQFARRYSEKFNPPLSMDKGSNQAKIDFERSIATIHEWKNAQSR